MPNQREREQKTIRIFFGKKACPSKEAIYKTIFFSIDKVITQMNLFKASKVIIFVRKLQVQNFVPFGTHRSQKISLDSFVLKIL